MQFYFIVVNSFHGAFATQKMLLETSLETLLPSEIGKIYYLEVQRLILNFSKGFLRSASKEEVLHESTNENFDLIAGRIAQNQIKTSPLG